MSAMLGFLKAMGIDPEKIKADAEMFWGRFVALEQRILHGLEPRIDALEARLVALEQHSGIGALADGTFPLLERAAETIDPATDKPAE